MPLLIQGGRGVGKTWLMREFGRLEYAQTAYFIFENNDRLERVFRLDFDARRMIEELGLLAGFKITPDTLIIFDEIQNFPLALTALKYFQEQTPEYHIIAAGSLLGITLHQGVSFPVGKVNFMTLYPLTFYEFLAAMGEDLKLEYLKAGKLEPLRAVHQDLIMLVKKYFYVGGCLRLSKIL